MKSIKKLLLRFRYRLKILAYNSRKKRLVKKVFSKDKITVVFFVLYDNMWKIDGLFELLMKNPRFSPFIISSPYPHHPRKFGIENQKKVELFFKKKDYPYINGYDFDKDKCFDIASINPDIVFYQQPYNTGYKDFKIETLWKHSIFGYVPYCYTLEDEPGMFDQLLTNIAWRVFLSSEAEVKTVGQYLHNNGNNLVPTGYPLAESLSKNESEFNCQLWKHIRDSRKRVIWAPHHSILDTDILNYSNFLSIAEDFLALADEYKDTIDFAFKPHPVLKRKLYKLEGWGEKKTDKYYEAWANKQNTCLIEGDYIDLFVSSDALIHDCSTFTAEYLYTRKPLMFISKPNMKNCFNEFGRMCFSQHYIGHNIEDIKSFIDNVVILGNDPQKMERDRFYSEHLVSYKGASIAQNMFNEFIKELE